MASSNEGTGSGFLRREWRELGRLVLESFGAGLFVSLVLALAVFIVSAQQAHAAPAEIRPGRAVTSRKATAARSARRCSSPTCRWTSPASWRACGSTQRFVNPTAQWREGVYVFPLPELAAVDHLKMHVGERVIEGIIKERGEAKRTYDAAKTEGRKATLVEQERPNMFTTSVANIGPNEEIVVAIEYQETLRYDDGSVPPALSAGDHAALHPRRACR